MMSCLGQGGLYTLNALVFTEVLVGVSHPISVERVIISMTEQAWVSTQIGSSMLEIKMYDLKIYNAQDDH